MKNSSFKRLEEVTATELRNAGVPLMKYQQRSEQQNVSSYFVEAGFYLRIFWNKLKKDFFDIFATLDEMLHCSEYNVFYRPGLCG